jgi:hypothetical protein
MNCKIRSSSPFSWSSTPLRCGGIRLYFSVYYLPILLNAKIISTSFLPLFILLILFLLFASYCVIFCFVIPEQVCTSPVTRFDSVIYFIPSSFEESPSLYVSLGITGTIKFRRLRSSVSACSMHGRCEKCMQKCSR